MVLLATCFWSTMGIFIRYLNQLGLYALEVTQIRVTVGGLVLGCYLLLVHRELLKI